MLRALSPRQFHTGVWHAAFADPPTDDIAWSITLLTLFPLSSPQLPCFPLLFPSKFPQLIIYPLLHSPAFNFVIWILSS